MKKGNSGIQHIWYLSNFSKKKKNNTNNFENFQTKFFMIFWKIGDFFKIEIIRISAFVNH